MIKTGADGRTLSHQEVMALPMGVSLDYFDIPPGVVALLPREFLLRYKCLPLSFGIAGNEIIIAVAEPLLDHIPHTVNRHNLVQKLVEPSSLMRQIKIHLGASHITLDNEWRGAELLTEVDPLVVNAMRQAKSARDVVSEHP